MLDFIRGLFKKEFQLPNTSTILAYLNQVILLLDATYTTDKKNKNEAIDAICKLLQEYKDQNVENNTNG